MDNDAALNSFSEKLEAFSAKVLEFRREVKEFTALIENLKPSTGPAGVTADARRVLTVMGVTAGNDKHRLRI